MVNTLQVSAIPARRGGSPLAGPAVTRTSPLAVETDAYRDRSVWAIVLAGGEDVRLRPRQYAALLDSRTLLHHTLERVGLLVRPDRTVIMAAQDHEHSLIAELDGPSRPHILRQPDDRGTATGLLRPAHWIYARDPHALVAVFPSDHFIAEDAAFMSHVAEVATFVSRHREWMVLLGAEPRAPETEYGWIEPGNRVGWTGRGAVYRIRRFIEKPSPELAGAMLAAGGLWNTFVLVASAAALIRAGMPALHHRLRRLAAFGGTEQETWAIRQACTLAPRANCPDPVLGASPGPFAVAKIAGITWCDLGSPERVARTLASLGISPPRWA